MTTIKSSKQRTLAIPDVSIWLRVWNLKRSVPEPDWAMNGNAR
jgi:hypothetical protein